MSSIEVVILGGIIGGVIGAFWGDPYRDSQGRYTTHGNGLSSWIGQSVMGAILGAMVTPLVLSLLVSQPAIGLLGLGVLYYVYLTEVDPR